MKVRGCTCLVFALWAVSSAAATAVPPGANPKRFDELVNIIRTGNAYQRARAIPSFAQIEDARVVPILVGLLEDRDDSVRVNTAQQLARLADERSADALAGALSDANGNVRRYAGAGLAWVGGERHVPDLVASVVHHLPDSGTSDYESRYSAPALEAIGKLSPQAPREIVGLLDRVSDERVADDEDWWRLLANAATCLGQIGDEAAAPALHLAAESLERTHRDYAMWCAARKALAAIDPAGTPFDSRVADVLAVRHLTKGDNPAQRREWARPLVELGQKAVADLEWALQFRGVDARLALEALGEIGGPSAVEAVRQCLKRQAALSTQERRTRRAPVNETLLALLKADARVATAKEVLRQAERLAGAGPERLVRDVAETAPSQIPAEVRIAFYGNALSGTSLWARRCAATELGRIGGTSAGEVLSGALLDPSNPSRELAARALGTIEGYDAMPTLLAAAEQTNAPAGAIAWALGRIGDPRAIPTLQAMADVYPSRRQDDRTARRRPLRRQSRWVAPRYRLSEEDRLWIAAALARLGVDYEGNAAFVRGALPRSMEQAAWLTDDETVIALETLVRPWHETESPRAVETLVAIGTSKALSVLMSLADAETDPLRLTILSGAAAKLARKRDHPGAERYETLAEVTAIVRGWFVMAQRLTILPVQKARDQIARAHAGLARRIWISETTRRLDLARAGRGEAWRCDIPEKALTAVEPIFDAELIPVLERIVAESRNVVSFHGRYALVRFHSLRSLAAGILSERTGRPYTFVDVDGRIHPGGWNPSMEP